MAIEQSKTPRLILVVDDEESVRIAVTRIIETYGHKVVSAETGEEALEKFDQDKFDIVFTDITLPGISGWDMARAIKDSSPATPVVVLTGWDSQIEKSHHGLADLVMTKPIKIKEIIKVINELDKNDTEG